MCHWWYAAHHWCTVSDILLCHPQNQFVNSVCVRLPDYRIAGGCPSGHGLSGMPFLSTRAFGAVAGMFIGGYLAGLAVHYPY
jgi:hypothetical protein